MQSALTSLLKGRPSCASEPYLASPGVDFHSGVRMQGGSQRAACAVLLATGQLSRKGFGGMLCRVGGQV